MIMWIVFTICAKSMKSSMWVNSVLNLCMLVLRHLQSSQQTIIVIVFEYWERQLPNDMYHVEIVPDSCGGRSLVHHGCKNWVQRTQILTSLDDIIQDSHIWYDSSVLLPSRMSDWFDGWWQNEKIPFVNLKRTKPYWANVMYSCHVSRTENVVIQRTFCMYIVSLGYKCQLWVYRMVT